MALKTYCINDPLHGKRNTLISLRNGLLVLGETTTSETK